MSTWILFAYRTAIHDSTKLSPFYVMYGRHPILPVDMDFGATRDESATGNTATVNTIKDITKQVVDRQHLAHNKVQENIGHRRDKRSIMRVGQLVLMKNNKNNHRMGSKLEDKWIGPYEITKCLDKGRVKLKSLQSGNTLENT